jgi:hypothetical protein
MKIDKIYYKTMSNSTRLYVFKIGDTKFLIGSQIEKLANIPELTKSLKGHYKYETNFQGIKLKGNELAYFKRYLKAKGLSQDLSSRVSSLTLISLETLIEASKTIVKLRADKLSKFLHDINIFEDIDGAVEESNTIDGERQLNFDKLTSDMGEPILNITKQQNHQDNEISQQMSLGDLLLKISSRINELAEILEMAVKLTS